MNKSISIISFIIISLVYNSCRKLFSYLEYWSEIDYSVAFSKSGVYREALESNRHILKSDYNMKSYFYSI
ncbi:MAG TPA: hypothetical protein P5235_12415, partial [Saprospiraceae bacterium]|nr:hypothetical protein [Saprospiraceae bacterium]